VKHLAHVGNVGGADGLGPGPAQGGEDLPRRSEQCPALRRVSVDVGEGQVGGAGDESRQRPEARLAPVHRGHHVQGADATVMVPIEQVERARVEFEPAGGAGKGGPELLVQLA